MFATRPGGLEPPTFGFEVRGQDKLTAEKTRTCEKPKNSSASYSAILLQKHPDLEQIITAWPELPEPIKNAILSMVRTVLPDDKV